MSGGPDAELSPPKNAEVARGLQEHWPLLSQSHGSAPAAKHSQARSPVNTAAAIAGLSRLATGQAQ